VLDPQNHLCNKKVGIIMSPKTVGTLCILIPYKRNWYVCVTI